MSEGGCLRTKYYLQAFEAGPEMVLPFCLHIKPKYFSDRIYRITLIFFRLPDKAEKRNSAFVKKSREINNVCYFLGVNFFAKIILFVLSKHYGAL